MKKSNPTITPLSLDNRIQKGYLCIIIAAILWGFIGPFGKMAYAQGIQPLEVAFWRALLAWCCFSTEMVVMRKSIRVSCKDILPLSLFSSLCVAFLYGAYQVTVDQGGAALASVLLYTAPAWVILLARLFFKEKIILNKLFALGFTASGIVLIALSQGGNQSLASGKQLSVAITAGLLSGFCYSLYYILGKFFSDKYSASVLFFYTLLPGALLLLPWFTFTEKSSVAWLSLILLSVISTYGAYHFYYMGLKYIEAGRASIVATLEPVVAVLVSWYWWGELFTPVGYGGAALVLIAVVLVIRR
jgi:drug/metabolite transporter (DMT)-like permease